MIVAGRLWQSAKALVGRQRNSRREHAGHCRDPPIAAIDQR